MWMSCEDVGIDEATEILRFGPMSLKPS